MAQAAHVLSREEHFRPGRLPLAVARVTGHKACALHRHEFSELVVVLRGSGLHVTSLGEWTIGAGDVFVLHGDQAHGYVNTADLDLVNILFDLDALGLPQVDVGALPGFHVLFELEPRYRTRDQFESRLRLGPEQLRLIAVLISRLEDELDESQAGSGFAALATFMLLLTDLSRYYSVLELPSAEPLLRLASVIGYLDLHYPEPVALDDLAEVACLSRRSLTRAFRSAYGDSPIDYLIRLRLDRAAALLSTTDLSVTEVSRQVGFSDSNYFARRFRQRYGASPSRYRRKAG